MNIDIDSNRVKAFFQLSLDKTFSKAAKSLGISQSALSQKIAKLEDELEVGLLIRSGKEIKLTNFGEELVRYYKTKRQLDESFLMQLNGRENNQSGNIVVAGYSSITTSVIIPIIAKIVKENHRIFFNIITKETYELPNLLKSGEVDFVIGLNEIKRENVENILIGQEENIHIKPKKSIKENSNELPFLDHDINDTTTFNFFEIQKKTTSFERCFLGDINSIIKGVENGIGQAIVSKHLVKNNVKVKKVNHPQKMKSHIYLSFLKKVYYPKIHLEFIKYISMNFKDYL